MESQKVDADKLNPDWQWERFTVVRKSNKLAKAAKKAYKKGKQILGKAKKEGKKIAGAVANKLKQWFGGSKKAEVKAKAKAAKSKYVLAWNCEKDKGITAAECTKVCKTKKEAKDGGCFYEQGDCYLWDVDSVICKK